MTRSAPWPTTTTTRSRARLGERVEDVEHHRPAAQQVQRLGARRAHPGALAGGEDDGRQRSVHAFHAKFLAAGDLNRTSTVWGTPSTLRRWPSLGALRNRRRARFAVDAGIATEVCARLGCPIPGDLAQVDALYRRWFDQVWFDPVGKALALREGRTPDGADATAWGRRWLETGLGGTCWAQSVAFASLLAAGGAETEDHPRTDGPLRRRRLPLCGGHRRRPAAPGLRPDPHDRGRPAAGRRCHIGPGPLRGVARTTGRALVPPVQARRAPVRLPPALDPPRPRRRRGVPGRVGVAQRAATRAASSPGASPATGS